MIDFKKIILPLLSLSASSDLFSVQRRKLSFSSSILIVSAAKMKRVIEKKKSRLKTEVKNE
jgi:hypothetical protein